MIPSWFVAGSIWSLLGVVLVCFGLLFVLEGVTYYEQQPPITLYIRSWTGHHMAIAVCLGLALVAGAAAAFVHFVADNWL